MLPPRWFDKIPITVGWRYAVILLGAVGLGALYRATAREVQVVVDGRGQRLLTHARSGSAVLRDLGRPPGADDAVSPPGEAPLEGANPVVELRTARSILIQTGTQTLWKSSPEIPVANILDSAGVALYPGDAVLVDGLAARHLEARSVPPQLLQVQPAYPIELVIDGGSRTIFSAGPALGDALWENGITLFEGDRISPAPATRLRGPLQAELVHSRPVQVALAGGSLASRSAADTVGGALAEIGVALMGLDYSLPAADLALPPDGQIAVVRVQEIIEVEQQPLPFETTYQPVDSLEIDQRSVVQAGAYGVSARRVRVRLEDGNEVARTAEGEWIAQEPREQILGYGTQIQIRSVSTDDGSLDYWRAVQMYATSYSPSRAGVSPSSPSFGITASGKRLIKGLVAIDRSLIPFGTVMYVPGYGFAEAADTGGGVRGRWIDLGYDDDNYVPWSGYVTVYFLTPVPSPDRIVWIFP
jgi:uncharacterized protein YabE (DUF348 family)